MNRDDYLARNPSIRRLFNAAFHRDQPEEFMTWRYASTIGGDADVRVALLEQDGEVLAHYGSSAVEFQMGERRLRAGLVGAAMTHPSLQGQGVFQKLGRRHEEEVRAAGYDFLFAFPHPSRHTDAIFLWKLQWEPVADMPTQSFDLTAHAAVEAPAYGFDDGFTRFDYDALTDRNGWCAARRTSAYLQWRYTNNPINQYRNVVIADGERLRGYAVVKFYQPGAERFADVVDFFTFDDAALVPLFLSVIDFTRAEQCSGVNVWAPRHHVARHELARIGFSVRLPVTYLSFKCFDPALRSELLSFSRWWITMGDSDVY